MAGKRTEVMLEQEDGTTTQNTNTLLTIFQRKNFHFSNISLPTKVLCLRKTVSLNEDVKSNLILKIQSFMKF